jgi:dihydropteroate synthase
MGLLFLNGFVLSNGATILRVHDVKEAVECVELYKKKN